MKYRIWYTQSAERITAGHTLKVKRLVKLVWADHCGWWPETDPDGEFLKIEAIGENEIA